MGAHAWHEAQSARGLGIGVYDRRSCKSLPALGARGASSVTERSCCAERHASERDAGAAQEQCLSPQQRARRPVRRTGRRARPPPRAPGPARSAQWGGHRQRRGSRRARRADAEDGGAHVGLGARQGLCAHLRARQRRGHPRREQLVPEAVACGTTPCVKRRTGWSSRAPARSARLVLHAASACLQERTLPGACRAHSQSACLPQGCSSGGSAAFSRCSICVRGEAEVRARRARRAGRARAPWLAMRYLPPPVVVSKRSSALMLRVVAEGETRSACAYGAYMGTMTSAIGRTCGRARQGFSI